MAISAVLPITLAFGHRGVDSQTVFVTKQETAQDLLAGAWTTQANLFATEANALETNVNNKEASAVASASTATTKAAEAVAARDIAVSAQIATEAALDSFDDRYLGSKSVAPTLDNDGNPLLNGATYWNTTNSIMYVYDLALTQWIANTFVPTSHTSLSGLDSDDHTQYHNDARGDTRYYTKAEIDNLPIGMTATEVSSATSITLTASSANIQAVTMTNTGLSVILPNATTLEAGHTFIIKNTGTNDLFIKDGSGALKLRTSAQQIAVFYCTNITTVAGVWAIGDESIGTDITLWTSSIFAGTTLTVNSVVSTETSVTSLSTTQALVAYRGTSGYLQACTLNISNATITAGAILNVNAVSTNYMAVTALSATQAVVVYRNMTSTKIEACTLNVAGTTVTNGTILIPFATAGTCTSITMVSSSQVLFSYLEGTWIRSAILSISGTTLTVGAPFTVSTVGVITSSVSTLSSTQVICVYRDSSNYLNARVLDITGTTITGGANLVTNSVGISSESVVALSSTQALVAFNDAGTNIVHARTLNISGNTVTVGTLLVTTLTTGAFIALTKMLDGRVVIATAASSSLLKVALFTISGTNVTIEPKYDVNAITTIGGSITTITSGTSVVTYSGTSSYLQTNVIGVVQ